VVGDGMVRKDVYVNQGDLLIERDESRSQSHHSSVERD
jgi:hypothetical protein